MANGSKWPWKRDAASAPGADLTSITELDLIDVTLATQFSGQPAEVPGLGLAFDSNGMTVRKADGVSYVNIPWASITGLSADVVGSQRHDLPTAVALDVESQIKTHRFLIPNVQPDALTGILGAISARSGRDLSQSQPRSRR